MILDDVTIYLSLSIYTREINGNLHINLMKTENKQSNKVQT